MAQGPLAGLGVLVVRPRAPAAATAAAVAAAGGRAFVLPVMEIEPVAGAGLEDIIERLDSFARAIFVSQNAVAHGLAAVRARRAWPDHLPAAAVGAGTRDALLAAGIREVAAPASGFDSESLLALPEFANVAGRRVVIFRGEGGREWLASALVGRGAQVEHAVCYRRIAAAPDTREVLAAWRGGAIGAVTVMSRESLEGLYAILDADGRALLAATPVLVPHERIAARARELGLAQIHVVAGPLPILIAALASLPCPPIPTP